MGMRQTMQKGRSVQKFTEEDLSVLNERDSRALRYVEKWSRVPEIGAGLKAMPESKAKNLAIMLEKQARHMKRMTEAQYSAAFASTPENMIRLVRLN